MSTEQVIANIRANHLKANIGRYENDPAFLVHWDKAWVDPGGTLFGPGPYLKVPVTKIAEEFDIVIRVYAPKALQQRLHQLWKPEPPR